MGIEFASFANLSSESLQKMRPTKSAPGEEQGELYQTRLSTLLDQRHPLYLLAAALKPAELRRVNVDTTVQEKAIAFPTDARLYQKARCVLVREAKRAGLDLRHGWHRKVVKGTLRTRYWTLNGSFFYIPRQGNNRWTDQLSVQHCK